MPNVLDISYVETQVTFVQFQLLSTLKNALTQSLRKRPTNTGITNKIRLFKNNLDERQGKLKHTEFASGSSIFPVDITDSEHSADEFPASSVFLSAN